MTTDADRPWVHLLETDEDAVAASVRRLQTLGLVLTLGALGTIGLEVAARLLWGPTSSSLAVALLVLSMIVVLPTGIAYLILPRFVRPTRIEITVGEDFLLGPTAVGSELMKFESIRRVRLDIAENAIVGVTIAARGLAIHAKHVKDPAILVRAIFEHGPDNIRWYRVWRPFRRLSREEVRALIEQSRAQPLDKLIPPSAALAHADELFPPAHGWQERLFGRGNSVAINAVSMRLPTGVSRYVMLTFLQMFKNGPATRVLRRSQPLPVVTFERETAEPPALEDVLNHIRGRCTPPFGHGRGPADGTINLTIQGQPCRVLCRVDEVADECCQLRLERMVE